MLLELCYLIPSITISRHFREALMAMSLTSLSRSLYLSYLALAKGLNIGKSGYFRGLLLLITAFLLFYYGPPESEFIALSFLPALVALFPWEVPLIVSISSIMIRRLNYEELLAPYVHALLSGLPTVISLSALSSESISYTLFSAALFSYRLLLTIGRSFRSLFVIRFSVGLLISLYAYLMLQSGRYVIGAAMIRPSTLGSEALWASLVFRKQELLMFSIASYALTLYTLYGKPLQYFLLGLLAFIFSVLLIAAYNELIS